jgi:hypothetical protein
MNVVSNILHSSLAERLWTGYFKKGNKGSAPFTGRGFLDV